MFKKWIAPFRIEASGEAALNHLRVISNHHRIQASPGYRQAAQYCVERLQAFGIEAEIVKLPADPNVYFNNWRSFREWHCKEAELTMIEPQERRLARYTEMELSIIQRSTATPPEGITAELVHVENAQDEAGYEGIDVKGKLVLATGAPARIFELAVGKFGAAGLVLDTMTEFPPLRRREDMMDAVQYMSFWWHDEAETGFGFAVSPRVGEELKALCQKGPVKLHARVDADLYVGEIENIEAFIPGETEEEVLLVSHLCHPKPGANDNASGPATLLETARALQKLINEGKVPKPRRGIRFLMMPEFTGTHGYISLHPERLKRTVAALNLDMVGGDQKKTSGPLTIEKPSRSLPSFVAELTYGIFSEVAQDVQNFTGSYGYSLTNYVFSPFSGGSDHFILADPSVGIPCPMMITWPDKTYHTSIDTVENIDPKLMEKVAVTAASYLMFVANAELPDLLMLAGRMTAGFAGEMEREIGAFADGKATAESVRERLAFLRDCQKADLRSLERLVPEEQKAVWEEHLGKKLTMLDAQYRHFADQLEALTAFGAQEQTVSEAAVASSAASTATDRAQDPFLQKVFVRRHSGPIDVNSGHLSKLTPAEQEAWARQANSPQTRFLLPFVLQYWLDGKRTLQEAIRCVEMEMGVRNVEFAVAYVKLLLRLDLAVEVE